MTKQQFWRGAWAVGIIAYFAGIWFWIVLAISSDKYPHPQPLPVYVLVLWVVLPIIWMLCSGVGLNDKFEYELGWRKEHYGPNDAYSIRYVDTTPAKRIALQWLAPFALTYFLIRKKWRKRKLQSVR